MQEIVTENINDLEFLKLILTTKIDEIKKDLEVLLIFPNVRTCRSLIEQQENLKKNKIYLDPKKAELEDKLEKERQESKKAEEYIEKKEALEDFEETLEKVENLVCVNGIIYNNEREEKIFYPLKRVLECLLSLKTKEGIDTPITIKELNIYINAVRKALQKQIHYEDDKVLDEILSYKVYENPHNYDIKNVEELKTYEIEQINPNDNLTEREKEAFFGSDAYKALGINKVQEKVKRIGEKK